jgi:hypothetical protein
MDKKTKILKTLKTLMSESLLKNLTTLKKLANYPNLNDSTWG